MNLIQIFKSNVVDVCATEVLSPPVNVSATVQDGHLLVTWNPSCQASSQCSEYQLDLGDQVQYVCVYGLLWMLIITERTHTIYYFVCLFVCILLCT